MRELKIMKTAYKISQNNDERIATMEIFQPNSEPIEYALVWGKSCTVDNILEMFQYYKYLRQKEQYIKGVG